MKKIVVCVLLLLSLFALFSVSTFAAGASPIYMELTNTVTTSWVDAMPGGGWYGNVPTQITVSLSNHWSIEGSDQNITKIVFSIDSDDFLTTMLYSGSDLLSDYGNSNVICSAGAIDAVVDYGAELGYNDIVSLFHQVFVNSMVFVETQPVTGSVFDNIMGVFSIVPSFIVGFLVLLTGLFWTGSTLTFMGYLAVAGLSFAVIFLIISLISRFLKFRG